MTLPWSPDLAYYGISPETGFAAMSLDDLRAVDAAYGVWEDLGASIPSEAESPSFRARVASMPVVSTEKLKDNLPALRRAHQLLAYSMNAFVFGVNAAPPTTLPASIAVPFADISAQLGIRPAMTYWPGNMWNWSLIDPSAPPELDNLRAKLRFQDPFARDEDWFELVPLAIDIKGGQMIVLMVDFFACISEDDVDQAKKVLLDMGKLMTEMLTIIGRMREKCDPDAFWKALRKFLGGMGGFPDGLEFEGVTQFQPLLDEADVTASSLDGTAAAPPQISSHANGESTGWARSKFGGSSAAQSPIIQAMSIFLSVSHNPTRPAPKGDPNFLVDMRNYMPTGARRFLRDLAQRAPLVRAFVTSHADQLAQPYDSLLELLAKFRERHMGLVSSYIIAQVRKDAKARGEETDGEAKGTGGSSLVPFLKQAKEETLDAKVGNSK